MEPLLGKEKVEAVNKFYKELHSLQETYFDYWVANTYLHWEFWISVLLTIIPWVLWIKYHKKESRYRLLISGFFVMIIASYLDFIGVVAGSWAYAGKAIPTIPSYVPWDLTLLPVTVMGLIEFKPKSSPLLKGIVYSFVLSFIGEPIFEWLGLYIEGKWSSLYSFPIYIVIYLAADFLSKGKYFKEV